MEPAHVGVRTRAWVAMAMVTEEMGDGLGVVKRRKLSNEKLRSSFEQTKAHESELIVDSSNVSENVRSGGAQLACCTSTASTEKPKALDLEVEIIETETDARYNIEFSKLSERTGDFKEESIELESSRVKELWETNKSSPKMPPEAEIEEFFASAQENLNKRFKHKYNFDIVNDIPLKGRFEWIKLKPEK